MTISTITTTDRKAKALEYLSAVGRQEYQKVEAILAPDLRFHGPAATRTSAADFIGALKRLSAIHLRNEVKHARHLVGQSAAVRTSDRTRRSRCS